MSLTEILLSVIALFVFLDWYEHSDDLLRVKTKYRKIRQNITAYFKDMAIEYIRKVK